MNETNDPVMVIACIPVFDDKNLTYAKELLGENSHIPWLEPYDNSVKGECHICLGEVWIGPSQQNLIEESSIPLPVVCHFCALVYVAQHGDEPNFIPLGSKKTSFMKGHELPE